MEPQSPEDRIAELERQLAEAKAAEIREARAKSRDGGDATQASPWLSSPAPASRLPGAPLDTRLALAPRRVPASFALAEMLPFRWWYVWVLFMVAITPIVLWHAVPAAFAPAAVLTLVGIQIFQLRRARTRRALLKWGQVARVTGSEIISRGTYYSGTTYQNMIIPVAHGWTVTRQLYSGPKTKTRVRYTLGDYQGELVVGGREYTDGVILADERQPARALCVTSFPYDLDRDAEGNWVGKLRTGLKIGMVSWVIIVVGWLALAAVIAAYATTVGGPITAARGGKISVGGISKHKKIACNDSYVTVSGITNTVTITGHCDSLTVSGNQNTITLDTADIINTSGVQNQITYHSGSPQMSDSGISNVVQQG